MLKKPFGLGAGRVYPPNNRKSNPLKASAKFNSNKHPKFWSARKRMMSEIKTPQTERAGQLHAGLGFAS